MYMYVMITISDIISVSIDSLKTGVTTVMVSDVTAAYIDEPSLGIATCKCP